MNRSLTSFRRGALALAAGLGLLVAGAWIPGAATPAHAAPSEASTRATHTQMGPTEHPQDETSQRAAAPGSTLTGPWIYGKAKRGVETKHSRYAAWAPQGAGLPLLAGAEHRSAQAAAAQAHALFTFPNIGERGRISSDYRGQKLCLTDGKKLTMQPCLAHAAPAQQWHTTLKNGVLTPEGRTKQVARGHHGKSVLTRCLEPRYLLMTQFLKVQEVIAPLTATVQSVDHPRMSAQLGGTGHAGATISAAVGGTPASTTVDRSGAWALPVTGLPLGTSTVTVTQTVAGTAAGSIELPVTVHAVPSATRSTLAVEPTTAEANGNHRITATVQLRDQAGNPLTDPRADVRIAADLGTLTPTAQQGGGTYTASLVSDTPGEGHITFQVNGERNPATATVTFLASLEQPLVSPTNGRVVAGTADPHVLVIITNPTGVVIGEGRSDGWGDFRITTTQPSEHGDLLTVITRNEHGFVSPPATVVVDTLAPDPPTVNQDRNRDRGSARP